MKLLRALLTMSPRNKTQNEGSYLENVNHEPNTKWMKLLSALFLTRELLRAM